MEKIYHEGYKKINGINMPFHCLIEDQLTDIDPRFLPDNDPNQVFWPPHYHEYMELIYILQGNVSAFINTEHYILKPDDLFIIFPNEPHRFTSKDGSGCRYGCIKFFVDIINTTNSEHKFEYTYNLNNSEHTRVFHSFDCVKEAFLKSAAAFDNQTCGFDILIQGYILQICASVFDAWLKIDELFGTGVSNQSISVFYKLIKKINERHGIMSATEASEFCHFSYGYFARTFKSVFHTEYKNYTRRLKIDYAKSLLLCTDDTVTQISEKLGYSSASHFIKDFKLVTNVSPKQYRNTALPQSIK